MTTPLLSIRGLRTWFYTESGVAKAVDGVDLDIAEGEVLGVVGESGSGKSVTALSIMRLVLPPGRVEAAHVRLEGEDLLAAMRELLIPQTTIITPNSVEARRLAFGDVEGADDNLAACADRLLGLGCEYVLITGTHENTAQVMNTLYGSDRESANGPQYSRTRAEVDVSSGQ